MSFGKHQPKHIHLSHSFRVAKQSLLFFAFCVSVSLSFSLHFSFSFYLNLYTCGKILRGMHFECNFEYENIFIIHLVSSRDCFLYYCWFAVMNALVSWVSLHFSFFFVIIISFLFFFGFFFLVYDLSLTLRMNRKGRYKIQLHSVALAFWYIKALKMRWFKPTQTKNI